MLSVGAVEVQDAAMWQKIYQRNNKQSGMKNIRCFPFCSDIHQKKRFCGRPVILEVVLNQFIQPDQFALNGKSCSQDNEILFAWAEFQKLEAPPTVTPGQTFSLSDLQSRERCRANLSLAWYPGVVTNSVNVGNACKVNISFNKQKQGWNYKWVANVHTHHQRHRLNFYLFTRTVGSNGLTNQLTCVQVAFSPVFQLCSLYNRRKKKRMLKELSPADELLEMSDQSSPRFSPNTSFVLPTKKRRRRDLNNSENDINSESFSRSLNGVIKSEPFFSTNYNSQQPIINTNLGYTATTGSTCSATSTRADEDEEEESSESGTAPVSSLKAPFPMLKNVSGGVWEEPQLPENVMKYFYPAGQMARNEQEELVNRKFWRFCILLTMMESHWARETSDQPSNEQSSNSNTHIGSYKTNEQKLRSTDPVAADLLLDDDSDDNLLSTILPDFRFNDMADLELMNVFLLEDQQGYDEAKKLAIVRNVQKAIVELAKVLISEETLTEKLIEHMKNVGKDSSMTERRHILLRFFLDFGQSIMSIHNVGYHDLERVFDLHPPKHILKLATQRLRVFNNFLTTAPSLSLESVGVKQLKSLVNKYQNTERDPETFFGANRLNLNGDNITIQRFGLYPGGNPPISSARVQTILQEKSHVLIADLMTEMPPNGKAEIMMDESLMNGWWLVSDTVLAGLDHIREKFLGSSWIARKLVAATERHYTVVKLNETKAALIAKQKLMSSGVHVITFDGFEHHHSDKSFLFPISLPIGKYYRALALERDIIMEEYYHPDARKMIQKHFIWQDDELIKLNVSFFEAAGVGVDSPQLGTKVKSEGKCADNRVNWVLKHQTSGWVLRSGKRPSLR